MSTKHTGIYKRNGSPFWWIHYSHRGKQYCESSKSTVLADAKRLIKKRLGEMGSGRFAPNADKVTMKELAELVREDYRSNQRRTLWRVNFSLTHVLAFFGNTPALDIPRRIPAYITARLAEDAANATVRKELAAIKRGLKLAAVQGLIPYKPETAGISVSNTRTGFVEWEGLQALLAELPGHLQPVALFAYYTGWRKGEIIKLKWAQVDFKAGTVRLEPGTTKNKDGRTYPFGEHAELERLLREQRATTSAWELAHGTKVEPVFWRPCGEEAMPLRDFFEGWRQACKRAVTACEKAEKPHLLKSGLLFHDLRRSAVRNMLRAGVSETMAMKLTGHRTRDMLDRYAIHSEGDVREAARKVALLHERDRG
jgi:integrase